MHSRVPVSRDHQTILCGLEVLRLIGERMESRHDVDREDIRVVLGFMRDVTHRCLENSEQRLLPLLSGTSWTPATSHLDASLGSRQQARTLFEELTRAAEVAAEEDFVSVSRAYTSLLGNLILEEHRFISGLVLEGQVLHQFIAIEREISQVARRHGQILHDLETKYTSPHCI